MSLPPVHMNLHRCQFHRFAALRHGDLQFPSDASENLNNVVHLLDVEIAHAQHRIFMGIVTDHGRQAIRPGPDDPEGQVGVVTMHADEETDLIRSWNATSPPLISGVNVDSAKTRIPLWAAARWSTSPAVTTP